MSSTEWEEEEAGSLSRDLVSRGFSKGDKEWPPEPHVGKPFTCWVPTVETEQMEQLLWGGHLWGGDRTTPGGLSEGEQKTARGYSAKMQIPGLS